MVDDASESANVAVEAPELGTAISRNLMAELVKLRKKRKIGQQPIADALGVTQGRVSQLENLNGTMSIEAVLIYAKAIGAEILVVPEGRGRKRDPKAE